MTTQTAEQAIRQALHFYAATESYASANSIPDVMRDQGRQAKEALAFDGWQPIASALKDEAVMVYSPSLGHVICKFSPRVSDGSGYRSDWVTVWDGERLANQPTHWMPLPADPEAR